MNKKGEVIMGQRFHGPDHMDMIGPMMGYSWFNIVWLLVLIVAVILIFILLVRLIQLTKRRDAQPVSSENDNEAIAILQERFAKGEISEDEYRKKYRVLKEE